MHQNRPINGKNIDLTMSVPIAQRYTDRKRDKQTNKKHPFFLSRRRAAADHRQTWHVDRACPYHFWAHLDFLCTTSTFGARGFRKLGGGIDPSQFCAYKFVIYEPNCTKF